MSFDGDISIHSVRDFRPDVFLEPEMELDPHISGGLKMYLARIVNVQPGKIANETARELVTSVADIDAVTPLFSAKPFRYAPVPTLPSQGVVGSAESSVRAAITNMTYMQARFGAEAFAAIGRTPRKTRAIEWLAPIDEDYQLRARGASGAGTFSLDLGLGVVDHRRAYHPTYKELWRSGIDTVEADGQLGVRFIRTGSGVKNHDEVKSEAFDEFRKRHRILPQRLLGIVGLYLMREFEPDFAVALTNEGARSFSTLGNSKGSCDYSAIFANIGFIPSEDRHWLAVPDFGEGFYDALRRAAVLRSEESVLHTSIEALNTMSSTDPNQAAGPLFKLCSDTSAQTIAREIAVARSRMATAMHS